MQKPNVEGCESIEWHGTMLNATCYGNKFTIDNALWCDKIYYSNGNLECIPNGSFLRSCSNNALNNRHLATECVGGNIPPKKINIDLSTWSGEYGIYKHGQVSFN